MEKKDGFTDREVCGILGIDINALGKLRKTARLFKMIEPRQRVTEKNLEIFKKTIEIRNKKGPQTPYGDAMQQALKGLLVDKIFMENPESRAVDCFAAAAASKKIDGKIDGFFDAFAEITDFLTALGDSESVLIIKNLQSLIVAKNAFIFSDASKI